MGTEENYPFIAPDRGDIPTDYSVFDGKRIGVNKGSIQVGFTEEWAKRQGIEIEIIEVIGTESESLEMLEKGELDAYVTVDTFVEPESAIPVCRIGSSDYYFAVNKDRPDLLADLEYAMGKI